MEILMRTKDSNSVIVQKIMVGWFVFIYLLFIVLLNLELDKYKK